MQRRSILENATLNGAYSVLRLIFPIITFPYISRVLGPTGIGIVSFHQSIAQYFIGFAGLGLPMFGMREVARTRREGKPNPDLVGDLVSIAVMLSAFATILYAASWYVLRTQIQSDAVFFLFGLTVFSSFGALDWFFRGVEDFRTIVSRNLVIRLLSLGAIFLLVRSADQVTRYAAIWVAESVISAGTNVWIVLRRYGMSFRRPRLRIYWAGLVSTFGIVVTGTLYGSLDKLMLGIMIEDQQASVGYYSLAYRLVRITITVLTAVLTTITPRVAQYDDEQKNEKRDRLIHLSIQGMMLIAAVFSVGLSVFADDLVRLFGGRAFVTSSSVLRVLSANVFVASFGGVIAQHFLFVRRKDVQVLVSTTSALVVAFAANLILIPRWGVVGAATATVVARIVQLSVQSLLARKELWKLLRSPETIRTLLAVAAWAALAISYKHLAKELSTVMRIVLALPILGVALVVISMTLRLSIARHLLQKLGAKRK